MLCGTENNIGEDGNAPTAPQTEQDKAKARRAQVRRAQIEHRQRKTNYVKQLEIDIAHIRNMIATTETENRMLQAENNALRLRLSAGAVPQQPSVTPSQERTGAELPEDTIAAGLGNTQLDSSDYITLNLQIDAAMNLPVYQISSEPKRSNHPTTEDGNALQHPDGSDFLYYPFAHLTPEQSQRVINFILALEHICWDHFRPTDFQPEGVEPLGNESGHALMATSLALRTAPAPVFDAMRARPPPPEQPPAALAAHAAATAEAGGLQVPQLSWQAPGLTLQSLYGLANCLNPPDVDLTPVQAWFELATRYPVEILLRHDVEDRLKKEFVGVVKCPHYGAAIERGAFESISARVLDPEVVELGVT